MEDWGHRIGLEEQDAFLSGLIADATRRKQLLRIDAAKHDAEIVIEELTDLRTAVRSALMEIAPAPAVVRRLQAV